MKKTILFSTLLAGLALAGCNKSTKSDTVATDTTVRDTTVAANNTTARVDAAARDAGNDLNRAANDAGKSLERAGDRTAKAMSNMAHNVDAKLTEWKLSSREIEADVTANRDIIRTKDMVGAPTGNTDKSALQDTVTANIKSDAQLANLKLDINADRKGEIQLEGKASSADQIGRAIAIALNTEGVYKVTSKVRIDKDAVKN